VIPGRSRGALGSHRAPRLPRPEISPMRRFVPFVLCLLAASPAWADAREPLHAAFVKFLAQPSFEARTHADVGGRAIDSTVEFVAPARYRVTARRRPPSA